MNWTPGRVKAFITSTIRSGFRRWPPKYEVLSKAKVGKKINKATGRMAEHYKCAKCKKHFVAKDIQIDHIEPCIDPKVGFVSWDEYINRMYCDASNLQALCKSCHKKKTDAERKARK